MLVLFTEDEGSPKFQNQLAAVPTGVRFVKWVLSPRQTGIVENAGLGGAPVRGLEIVSVQPSAVVMSNFTGFPVLLA